VVCPQCVTVPDNAPCDVAAGADAADVTARRSGPHDVTPKPQPSAQPAGTGPPPRPGPVLPRAPTRTRLRAWRDRTDVTDRASVPGRSWMRSPRAARALPGNSELASARQGRDERGKQPGRAGLSV
jgi:hypothetical protein